MLRQTIPRPVVTRSNTPYTFHPDMLDETKTMSRLTGDVQEGISAFTPSDFGVNFTFTIHGAIRPSRDTLSAEQEAAASKTIVGKITPLKILLNELEADYEVLKPIPVVFRKVDDSFVASFIAANVNSSGDTWTEAIENLRSLLVGIFDLLLTHRPEELGPAPKYQLSVLRAYIRKSEDAH